MAPTIHSGMIAENTGNWRPAIAESFSTSRSVTWARVVMGIPMLPKATGAVLAMSDNPLAWIGENPSCNNRAAVIATGAPNPAAPSMKAPKQKAINTTWIRGSGATRIN